MAAKLRGKVDISVVAAGLVAVVGVLGFVGLMVMARAASPYAFDTQILLALREAGNPAVPLGPYWLQNAVRDITSLGSTTAVFLITAAAAIYLLLIRQVGTALFLFFVVGFGQIILSLLKNAVGRARPDIVSHLDTVSTLSFPSGHAMMSAVTYLTLSLLAARFLPGRAAKIYVLALGVGATFLIGISRLYLGVHWPSDVMAGWCAGFAWVMLCWLAARFARN